jgi:peptidyl-prolyl cis-trans isomerase C
MKNNDCMMTLRLGGAVLCLFAIAGCGDKDLVAMVGKAKLRRADLAQFASTRGRAGGRPTQELLAGLVDRTLLAEGARRDGVQNAPAVQVRLRAAEREILAETFLEKELRSATDEGPLRKRYEDTKEALKRRQIQVAHIVLRVPSSAGAEARNAAQSKAADLYSKLRDGADFEKLAAANSEDSATAARGGDLGILVEGSVDQGFFDAAAALKKGEISKPFETPFGVHIVRAFEDPQVVTPPFEEVRGKLAAEARLEAERKLLERLRSEVKVKTYPERLSEEHR